MSYLWFIVFNEEPISSCFQMFHSMSSFLNLLCSSEACLLILSFCLSIFASASPKSTPKAKNESWQNTYLVNGYILYMSNVVDFFVVVVNHCWKIKNKTKCFLSVPDRWLALHLSCTDRFSWLVAKSHSHMREGQLAHYWTSFFLI